MTMTVTVKPVLASSVITYSLLSACVLLAPYFTVPYMKNALIQLRIEPSLKISFLSAARFRHQTLSQFLVQAGISAVEESRERGLGVKSPPEPRDCRCKGA